jgi:hypothetical protein
MVTTILSSWRVTFDPGMSRRMSPSLRPAAWPAPFTTSAAGDWSRVKLMSDCCERAGAAGPAALTTVCIPAATSAAPARPSRPVVRTTPSVVFTMVLPLSSSEIWNAVPCTVAAALGVATS